MGVRQHIRTTTDNDVFIGTNPRCIRRQCQIVCDSRQHCGWLAASSVL